MLNWAGVVVLIVGAALAYRKGVKEGKPWGKPVVGACVAGVLAAVAGLLYYYLVLGLLVAVLFAYIKGVRQHKEWGRPLLTACTIAVVVLAVGRFVLPRSRGTGRGETRQAIERELAYVRAQMVYLGRYLAEKYPRRNVLLLVPKPTYDYERKRNDVAARSLEEGLDVRLTLAAREEIAMPEEAGAGLPAEEKMVDAAALDALAQKYGNCDLIVTLVNLPYDYEKTKLSKMPQDARPLIVVAAEKARVGLAELIRSGHVAAAVVPQPVVRYDPDEDVPGDVEKAFKSRYLLVDAENADQIP